MCEYPKIFSKVLEDLKSTTYSTSIGEPGRKVIERILMELFCQNVDSVNFRDCPDKIIVSQINIRNYYSLSHEKKIPHLNGIWSFLHIPTLYHN